MLRLIAKDFQIKGYNLHAPTRAFSVAFETKDRFKQAWEARQAQTKKRTHEPENKAEYGQGYYQANLSRMKNGYVHPYHTEKNPLVFDNMTYLKTLFEAVGPEQVSPHYESFSRTRRGVIFMALYVSSLTTLSHMGGWAHNEWIRGLVFHHEFLIAVYLGFIETRHFSMFVGPKYSVFYNVFSRYEAQQLMLSWADTCEEKQYAHVQDSKEQLEYLRLHNEYEHVKKRSLVNFLTNERLEVEKHMHERALAMLRTIYNFEQGNLRAELKRIVNEALESSLNQLRNEQQSELHSSAFASALEGIRRGEMNYREDPILPLVLEKIRAATQRLKNLTPEQEAQLL